MSHLYLLGVASLTLTSAGFAGSDMNADLQTRLEAAEARIAELSADQNQNWLNDERADAVRSLVQDVLADADTRASLQGAGPGAGYDDGFTIASSDGNWSLKINGGLWSSWSTVDDESTGGTDTDGGFDDQDTWMNFSGTVAGDWSWDVRYNWGNADGQNLNVDVTTDPITGLPTDIDVTASNSDNDLQWANATWNVADGWDLTLGSFRLHQSRTNQISEANQMEIGHNPGATVGNGVSLAYTADDSRFWAEFTNSSNGVGTDNDGDYNTNLRYEYMAEGNWGQFDAFTSAQGGAAGTLIGVGYYTLSNDDTGGTDGDAWWNVDVQMQFDGYGLYASYTDYSDDASSAADWDRTDLMGSYYMNSDWEVYVAYSDRSDEDGETVGIGVNNYWAGQNAKWTTQYTTDDSDSSGDVTTISTQIQLYF